MSDVTQIPRAGGIECNLPSGTEPEYTGPISSRWMAPERPAFSDPAKVPSEAQVHNRKVLAMSQLLKSRGLLKPKTCARTVTQAAVRDDEATMNWHAVASELKPPVGKVPDDADYKTAWEKDFKASRASHDAWQARAKEASQQINLVRYDIGTECVRLDTTPDQIFPNEAAARAWLEENGVTTAKWMGYVTGHMGAR